MTPEEIRAAVAANPALVALAHATPPDTQGIADALSAGRTRVGTVSTPIFASWAAGTGMRAVIEDLAADKTSPLRGSALALRDVLMGGATGIRLDYPANQQMLAAWVAVGALTQANHDALLALATGPDPVAEIDVRRAILADNGGVLV